MKKKIRVLGSVLGIICICSISFMGYLLIKTKSENRCVEEFYNLQMKVENATPSGATLIFTHSNPDALEAYTTTGWSLLVKESDGKWVEVELINTDKYMRDFISVPFIIKNDSKAIFEENWEQLYGNLSEGNYQIYKEISDSRVIVGGQRTTIIRQEFSIGESTQEAIMNSKLQQKHDDVVVYNDGEYTATISKEQYDTLTEGTKANFNNTYKKIIEIIEKKEIE